MHPLLSALFLALTVATVYAIRHRRYRSLKHLRGPQSPSWLLGHEFVMTRQEEVGQLDFAWAKEFGPTWVIKSHMGSDVLMTADPKAMQHIFHKSGYSYPKRRDMNEMAKMFGGEEGIVAAVGDIHQRQRKIMNPAFSATQLRTFLTLFQDIGMKMCEKWKNEVLDSSAQTIFVNKWLAKTTLDIIGGAAFDYDYGCLSGADSDLSKAYNDLFTDVSMHPSKSSILYRLMWNYLPDRLLELTKYTPTRQYSRLRYTNKIFTGVASQLLAERNDKSEFTEKASSSKDVMSILENANKAENPKAQLSRTEMLGQMQSLTLAGHETTANTLSWLLWELSKHPQYQTRMREEIRTFRAKATTRGDARFTIDDLDSMTAVVNALKETLRFHPIVPNLVRMAAKDDIIPLSEPITSVTGEIIDAIPIRAGQWVQLSLCAYNRLPQVWGEDADQWNPDRFLKINPAGQVRVGMFANLMSFSAGVRGCIGWRFSLIEMQALAAELLERFEFGVPEESYDIIRAPAGIMVPLVRGKMELGSVMPLRVSPL